MENFKNVSHRDNYVGNINLKYTFDKHWSINASTSMNQSNFRNEYYVPFLISNSSAPELYNPWSNSFGIYKSTDTELNYTASLNYKNEFGNFDIDAFIGGNIRHNNYDRISAQMPVGAKQEV